jgi:uncharacterized membrane protein
VVFGFIEVVDVARRALSSAINTGLRLSRVWIVWAPPFYAAGKAGKLRVITDSRPVPGDRRGDIGDAEVLRHRG